MITKEEYMTLKLDSLLFYVATDRNVYEVNHMRGSHIIDTSNYFLKREDAVCESLRRQLERLCDQ